MVQIASTAFLFITNVPTDTVQVIVRNFQLCDNTYYLNCFSFPSEIIAALDFSKLDQWFWCPASDLFEGAPFLEAEGSAIFAKQGLFQKFSAGTCTHLQYWRVKHPWCYTKTNSNSYQTPLLLSMHNIFKVQKESKKKKQRTKSHSLFNWRYHLSKQFRVIVTEVGAGA